MNAQDFARIANEAASKLQPKEVILSEYDRLVQNANKCYLEFILDNVKVFAEDGFGSCILYIDYTTELFHCIESPNRCYIASYIIEELKNLGFSLIQYFDHYDAKEYYLIWDNNLEKAQIKIPMDFTSKK